MFRFVHSLSVNKGEGLGEDQDPSVDYSSSQEFLAAISCRSFDGKAKICSLN